MNGQKDAHIPNLAVTPRWGSEAEGWWGSEAEGWEGTFIDINHMITRYSHCGYEEKGLQCSSETAVPLQEGV